MFAAGVGLQPTTIGRATVFFQPLTAHIPGSYRGSRLHEIPLVLFKRTSQTRFRIFHANAKLEACSDEAELAPNVTAQWIDLKRNPQRRRLIKLFCIERCSGHRNDRVRFTA